jgi:anaerobic nitric oxide reductase flavorubredoxin
MDRFLLHGDVWWVGAIDWNVRDFHGYDTPRGSTYNAYLVVDDKVALIDGCREGFGHEMLARVRGCCQLRPVDYFVINHVEPDHSGEVPWLIEQLRPERIFCTKRGKEELGLIYGVDLVESWNIQLVGTGDSLPLGRNTLRFLETPMVHWPDTMFTYVEGSKTLLPNDAFGQHLASSKRFADEVDMNMVMFEASTYYANILMPFASPIQKAIAKIQEMGLEIEAIGSSHGVAWRRPEDVQRIIDAYLRWSNFEAPERVCLVYDSMWHSTERMTMAIADGVAQEGVECQVLKLGASARSEAAHQILESKAFLVGTPTLNTQMFPTVGGFMTYMKGLRPKNRISGAYGSYGWSGGAVKQVDAELRALGLDVVDPLEIKFMPNPEQLDACAALGRLVARKVKGTE